MFTVLGSAAALIATAVPAPAAVAAAGTSAHGTQRVIVVLRNQLTSTPARDNSMAVRTARADQTQGSVLDRLAGPSPSHVVRFALANAFAATVTPSQEASLAADPAVQSVVPDAAVAAEPPAAAVPANGAGQSSRRATARPNAGVRPDVDGPNAICPSDPAQPLVEPEALNTIHAYSSDGSPSAQDLTDGSGVKVAYIADGIDPNNPDFIRPDGTHAIIDYQDFSGSGPDAPTGGGEAFGDASAIAAQGTVTYDLSNFVNANYPLPPGCTIRILGVAPGASIVAIKAGGEFLTNSSILQSIDYAVRVDHVNVINESFGLNQFPDDSNRNTIKLFNDAAVAAGVTITESTGDGGVTGTVGSDAQDPDVISVGASTDSQLYAQTGYAGARFFGNGQWADNNISALSSGGFTQRGRTPDLVAPGEADWAACEASPNFASCTNFNGGRSDIEAFGGTSQSSPLTAGVAALVISAYQSTHHGHSPSPAVVKQIITGTTTDLGLPPYEQGSGLLNARAATEAALTWPGAVTAPPAGVSSNVVTSTDQVTLTGNAGSSQSASVRVTNVGDTSVKIATGTRRFSPLSSNAQAVSFDSTTLPTFPFPTTGAPWAYKQVSFSVPSGASRLLTRMAWAGSRPTGDAVVRVSLFDPSGTYIANSRPQGGAVSPNYANVDVRNPAPGTWTAVMYSPSGASGYTGVVGLAVNTYRSTPYGSVTPTTATLAPGHSTNVKFRFVMPSTASGDQDIALTIATSTGQQTAVGVVLRSLIPISHGQGHYSGDVTGGNARAVTPGETSSYEFDVPAHQPSLDVSTVFQQNPGTIMDLVLTDPNGELADVVTNETVNAAENALVLKRHIQSFTADPIRGRWILTVVAQNPVNGTTFDQPFSGTVSFAPVPVTSSGSLPDSPSRTLARHVTKTVQLKVTNSGVQPILVGVDPRTTQFATLQPVAIQGQTTFALPADPSQEPTYTAPPDTNRLTVTASSTTPAQLELQGSAAGDDLFGSLADAQNGDALSVATVGLSGDGNYISRGIWFTNMQQIGPFSDAGAPAGQTTITASMHTLQFDPTVTSSTGDPYGNAVDPSNDGFGTPVRILPGQTKTITVEITPTASAGKVVKGLLNLVTVPNLPSGSASLPQTTTGEVISTLPYEYRVG